MGKQGFSFADPTLLLRFFHSDHGQYRVKSLIPYIMATLKRETCHGQVQSGTEIYHSPPDSLNPRMHGPCLKHTK